MSVEAPFISLYFHTFLYLGVHPQWFQLSQREISRTTSLVLILQLLTENDQSICTNMRLAKMGDFWQFFLHYSLISLLKPREILFVSALPAYLSSEAVSSLVVYSSQALCPACATTSDSAPPPSLPSEPSSDLVSCVLPWWTWPACLRTLSPPSQYCARAPSGLGIQLSF